MDVFTKKDDKMRQKLIPYAVALLSATTAFMVACDTSTTNACKTKADCDFGKTCTDGKCVAVAGTGGGSATGGGTTATGGGTPATGGGSATGGGMGTGGGMASGQTIEVVANVTADTAWTTGNTYVLKNLTYVDNAVLTIQPGVKVLGDKGSALLVTRTGRLEAVGTAAAPIVMSANFPVGTRGGATGKNWGGVVLMGKAAINVPTGINNTEGVKDDPLNKYGGGDAPDNTHNCGTLKYVRIEFAGEPLQANDELNGLTLNACGSKTTIDYVQVHRSIDDGIEIFGGTVNVKHAVVTGSDDDGLDWDQGWTGKAQFYIIQQLSNSGNNGIEADNNRANTGLLPRSNPQVFNVTMVGRKPEAKNGEGPSQGMLYRVGTAGTISNVIVTNFTEWTLFVDGPDSANLWTSGELSVKNSIFFNNGAAVYSDVPSSKVGTSIPTPDLNEGEALKAAALSNREADPMLTDISNATKPNFKPKAGSPVLSGGATPPNDGFFDTAATFVGAVGADDWTAGWTAFPEN